MEDRGYLQLACSDTIIAVKRDSRNVVGALTKLFHQIASPVKECLRNFKQHFL